MWGLSPEKTMIPSLHRSFSNPTAKLLSLTGCSEILNCDVSSFVLWKVYILSSIGCCGETAVLQEPGQAYTECSGIKPHHRLFTMAGCAGKLPPFHDFRLAGETTSYFLITDSYDIQGRGIHPSPKWQGEGTLVPRPQWEDSKHPDDRFGGGIKK